MLECKLFNSEPLRLSEISSGSAQRWQVRTAIRRTSCTLRSRRVYCKRAHHPELNVCHFPGYIWCAPVSGLSAAG